MDYVAVCPHCGGQLPVWWAWLSPYESRRCRQCGEEIRREREGMICHNRFTVVESIAVMIGAIWLWGPIGLGIGYLVCFVVLLGLWPFTARFEQATPDYATCQTCGYNLTGNVSGLCPEC